MVGDLEHVEAPPVGDAVRDKPRVDLLLDVPGEQETARPEADVEDERHVVDARARIWWFSGHAVAGRPAHIDRRAVEREVVARRQAPADPPQRSQCGAVGGVSGAGTAHPGLGDGIDPIARQEQRQAGCMVLVGMGEHDQVDAPVPRRQAGIEQGQQPVGIGARVHQEPRAAVALQEDRITLPDIEDGESEATVRPGRGAERDRGDERGEPDQGRARDDARR